ncbi:MAG TPA: GPW/gp25 family protein [Acidimicrobiales bacterium]|nr:GPW/gp25 family protein [Acidimicrobiales bacterium]
MTVVRPAAPGDYLGRGAGFPFAPGPDGRLPKVAGPDAVRQAIVTILDTEPGERLMRPGFGCALRRYLMEPNSAAVRGRLAADVRDALVQWEPRIRVESIEVVPTEDPAAVLVTVHYVHVRDLQPGTLVHPLSLR